MKPIFKNQHHARDALQQWQKGLESNIFKMNSCFRHTVTYFLHEEENLFKELQAFGEVVPEKIEPNVQINHKPENLPKIEKYNKFAQVLDKVIHHQSYIDAGEYIYQSKILAYFKEPGGMTKAMMFAYLSAHAGEAGHNCPLACSAGIIRVLTRFPQTVNSAFYLEKLMQPHYRDSFSGAQFLTEIQGGSDLGANEAQAILDAEGKYYHIYGEKWFCSNANADLFLVTARVKPNQTGTKGLGLFLVPAKLNDELNYYNLRRLKNKIGTQTLATAEIEFNGSHGYPIGNVDEGAKIVLEHVLNISRIFNAVIVMGMANRAWQIAKYYSQHRFAFGKLIQNYPLVQENLARIRAENLALSASVFAAVHKQDQIDLNSHPDKSQVLLLRLLINMNKYLTALWSFDHIHHAIDVLAGNGVIEDFSSLPRLLRDCIICENWEGTHNTLRMQILRDLHKYHVDGIFVQYIHDEVAKIEDNSILPVKIALDTLKDQLSVLKNSGPDEQTLLIKGVVDQMVKIHSALCLFKEGKHQKENDNSDMKLQALELFNHFHFNAPCKDYLARIAALS